MTRTIFIAAALAFAVTLPAVPAQAQANRTFVSAAGSDSNNCANVISPCRHFAAAYAVTAPSGEIFVLDPANYGSLTITHAVSIEGHGWASIAPPNGGNAITINAGSSDSISIHGVSIDGTGATGGTNGIVFNIGGSLTITDCVIQNFAYDGINLTTGNGILMQPTAGTLAFTITNTTASNNGATGILFLTPSGSPSANGVIDHVVADANHFDGVSVDARFTTGGAIVVTVSDSIASNNGSQGIFAGNGSAPLKVSIDNVTVSGNFFGIVASTPANVLLGRSVITGNGTGVQNSTSPNTLYTYGNNQINLNTPDLAGTALNTTFTPR
jgi:hypothetical protein